MINQFSKDFPRTNPIPEKRFIFALFYGDFAIIPLLSSESAGCHFTISYLVSLTLLLSIFMLKKLIMRKLPTQQRLKELVVGNFLNVFSLLVILAMVTGFTGVVAYHFQTINENSKSNIKKAPADYWKDLLVIATLETVFRWTPFIKNPTLR